MSTMKEMAQEYHMAAAKIKMKIKCMEENGVPEGKIRTYRNVLRQMRDTARLLSGYYDTPRQSEDAAIGWKSDARRQDR